MKKISWLKNDWRRVNDRLTWLGLGIFFLVLFAAVILTPTLITVAGPTVVPFHLHSVLSANYASDPIAISHARLELAVISDILNDMSTNPSGEDFPAVYLGLETPVPTVTPQVYLLTLEATSVQISTTPPVSTRILPTRTTAVGTPQPTIFPNLTPTTNLGLYTPVWTLQFTPTPKSALSTFPAATPTNTNSTQAPTSQATIPPLTQVPPSETVSPDITSQAPTATLTIPMPTRTLAPTQPPTLTTVPTATPVPYTVTPVPTSPPPPTNTPRPRPTRTPHPYPPPYP